MTGFVIHFDSIFTMSCFPLLQRLLVCNPTGRMSADEGLQHGYFSDLSPSVKFPSDPYRPGEWEGQKKVSWGDNSISGTVLI